MTLHNPTALTSANTTKINVTKTQQIAAECVMIFNQAVSHYPIGTQLDMNNYILVTFHQNRLRTSIKEEILFLYRLIHKSLYSGKHITDRIAIIGFPDYEGSRSGATNSRLLPADHCHVLIIARSAVEQQAIIGELKTIQKQFESFVWKKVTDLNKPLMEVISYCMKGFIHDNFNYHTGHYVPVILPYMNARKGQKATMVKIAMSRYQVMKRIPNRYKLI